MSDFDRERYLQGYFRTYDEETYGEIERKMAEYAPDSTLEQRIEAIERSRSLSSFDWLFAFVDILNGGDGKEYIEVDQDMIDRGMV